MSHHRRIYSPTTIALLRAIRDLPEPFNYRDAADAARRLHPEIDVNVNRATDALRQFAGKGWIERVTKGVNGNSCSTYRRTQKFPEEIPTESSSPGITAAGSESFGEMSEIEKQWRELRAGMDIRPTEMPTSQTGRADDPDPVEFTKGGRTEI